MSAAQEAAAQEAHVGDKSSSAPSGQIASKDKAVNEAPIATKAKPADDAADVQKPVEEVDDKQFTPAEDKTNEDAEGGAEEHHHKDDEKLALCPVCNQKIPEKKDDKGKELPAYDPFEIPYSYVPRQHTPRSRRYYDIDEERRLEAPPPPEGPYVNYKLVYTDPRDRETLYDVNAYEAIPLESGGEIDQTEAIFDIVATVKALYHIPSFKRNQFGKLHKAPPASKTPKYTLHIRSPAIIRALQSVVSYYPGVDLYVTTITLEEPFEILVHHYDELQAYREARKPDSLTEDACAVSRSVYEHLGLLLKFLDERVMDDVRKEQARYARGVATYQMLWLLFRPGSDCTRITFTGALSDRKGGLFDRDGAIVDTVNTIKTPDGDVTKYTINTWDLRYDGNEMGRTASANVINHFDGEMELSKLAVLPVQYSPLAPDGTNAKNYLTKKGEIFYKLLQPQCKHHRGETLEFPFPKMEGQVQVDFPSFYEEYNEYRPALMEPYVSTGNTTKSPCMCPACIGGAKDQERQILRVDRYDSIIPEANKELTKHHYFLCPQSVWAYMFKARDWQLLDVLNLNDAEFKRDMIDTLVMQESRLKLLKALSKSFTRTEREGVSEQAQSWTADFVKGKGNSQIFLLHGPPGVGKTYTAECIAEHSGRPLMTLTSSDIGIQPSEVETKLETNFNLAKKWGAILLIDEADVYLERRTLSDLTRNSLVAGFLRALEFYEGILFLTTNRVGSFDDAFISRIHVKLHYPILSDEDRLRIWQNFIEKLKRERKTTMRVMRDVSKYVSSPSVSQLKLNGREIRNIFQTAVGLAEYEAEKDEEGKIKVTEEHLAQVVDMSGDFKKYLDDLHVGDEEKRAERSHARRNEHQTPQK